MKNTEMKKMEMNRFAATILKQMFSLLGEKKDGIFNFLNTIFFFIIYLSNLYVETFISLDGRD